MIDEKIFPFLAEKGHVISLVGGGGKTTLMYNLAAHCARKGWRVLAATTTHIMQPPGGVWAQTDAELFRLWKCGSYAVAGTAAHGGKLTAPPQAQLERWMTLADIVLIEADGAKRMPCKARCARAGAFTAVRYGSGRSRAFCVEASAPGGLFPGRACRRAALCSAGCAVDTGTSGKAACK